MRIYLIGFMGVGKTHWGKLLGKKLGIPFFDLDELIENDEGRSIAEMFFLNVWILLTFLSSNSKTFWIKARSVSSMAPPSWLSEMITFNSSSE